MNLFLLALFMGFVLPKMEGQDKQPIQVNSGAGSLETAVLLPDAPSAQAISSAGADSTSSQTASSITGEVTDESGADVPAAKITLSDEQGGKQIAVQSGPQGEFTLTGLPAGTYRLTITATGFEVYKSAPLIVARGQSYPLAQIQLRLQALRADVTVYPTDVIAAQQIRAEEKQRVFGVAQNFYVSYVSDAAPLTAQQKFTLSVRDTFDPFNIVLAAAEGGIDQANKTFPGYGYGAAGYGKRVAARYGTGLTDNLLSDAFFPALLHQDPRYFYQGSGSFKSRFIHAVSFSVIARSDTGRAMPSYSAFFGDVSSGALANLYYPHADRGSGLVFSNAGYSIVGRALGGLLQEFVLRKITTNAP